MSNPIPRQEYIRSGTVESLNVTGELKYQGVPVAPGGGTDEKAKVSSNDTTPGYLDGKLVAGSGITLTQNSDGGDETLTITSADTNDAVKVSSNDTTPGDLEAKLVAGTNITLTTNNDGGNETLTIDASGGGVTGFTGSQNTASPNNTVNASRLLVDATSTNADAVIQPKGTGALLAQLPDGAATGGNKRGLAAIDLSLGRISSSQVASGTYSMIAGGIASTASGYQSTVIGSRNATASATGSVIIGGTTTDSKNNAGLESILFGMWGANSISANANYNILAGRQSSITNGDYSLVFGRSCSNSGMHSLVHGFNNSNTGPYSLCFGNDADSTGSYSLSFGLSTRTSATASIALGVSALADRFGMYAKSSGPFAATGDCQYEQHILRRATTDATPTILSCDGAAPATATQIAIASDATYTFRAIVTARRTDADNESAGWEIKGVIDNNAGTTALVGSATVTALGDDSSGTWLVAVEADNTNDALVIKVTGENSKTIRWGATVTLMKVAG